MEPKKFRICLFAKSDHLRMAWNALFDEFWSLSRRGRFLFAQNYLDALLDLKCDDESLLNAIKLFIHD